jgi:hypothetical protein
VALGLGRRAGAHPPRPVNDLVCGSQDSSPYSNGIIRNRNRCREIGAAKGTEGIRRTDVDVGGDDRNKEDKCGHCHDGEADDDISSSHASEHNPMGRIVLLLRTLPCHEDEALHQLRPYTGLNLRRQPST